MDLAVEKNDHAAQVFLQWFVSEQVEEVKTMSELLQIVRRAGELNLLLVEDYVARSAAAGAEG
jgi:ferritin